jgi:diguanylate cyclase (GGDEF)-like protein
MTVRAGAPVRRFYLSSVRNKLFAVVLLTSLAALLVTGISMAVYDLRSYRERWVSDLNMQAELIGRACIPALEFNDRDLAKNNLALLEVRPQVKAAALYNTSGFLYASYGEGVFASSIALPLKSKGIQFNGEEIELYRSIVHNGDVVGLIYLKANYALNDRLMSYLGILLAVTSFALLVSLILSAWLQAIIMRPIHSVTELARRVVERRDYSLRATKTTEDEIGFMVDAFNSMLREIEGRTADQLAALKESELERERTLYISQHDALTGLPNRSMFNKQLDEAIKGAQTSDSTVHVLFIDVDRFKEINDTLGHSVGDILLAAVAKRLQSHIRKTDFLARLSGDEFGIICRNQGRIEDLAATLVYELSRPFSLEDHHVSTSVSIGITSFPEDSNQPAQLLANADMAMYGAKSDGRSAFRLYSADMEQAAKRRHTIKVNLHAALAGNALAMHYQPVFSLQDNSLCSVEALIRWPFNDISLLTPTELVDVAEDTGMIIELGEWILRTVCNDMRQWQDQGYTLRVAINISSIQLKEPLFLQVVDRILEEYELSPSSLNFEITERVLVENNAINRELIEELSSRGIQISVDDFGTGFSSLSYLKYFTVHALKIDQTFVRGLPADKEDVAITTAIISLAKGLGINVVAEGIENREQLEFLKSLNCEQGQGYIFSRPLTHQDLLRALREETWRYLPDPPSVATSNPLGRHAPRKN